MKPEWLDGVEAIGVTAGASAPDVLVEDVISVLGRHRPVEISSLDGVKETIQFKLPPQLAAE